MNTFIEVPPSKAKKLISQYLSAGLVPQLKGSPGLAKSAIMQQVAKEMNLKFIDVRLSQMDPVDLNGYPFESNKRAVFLPGQLFPLEEMDEVPEGKDGWLIALDELTSASKAVQAAAYKLILDRMVGNHDIHYKAHIIAAGNKETDNAIVIPQSSALRTRMVHIHIKPSYEDWVAWAEGNEINHKVISYIHHRPGKIYDSQALEANEETYSNPRTLEFSSNYITECGKDIVKEGVFGIVGLSTGKELWAFLSVKNLLPDFNSIIKTPKKAKIPEKKDACHLLLGTIVDYIANEGTDDISNIILYVKRMPYEFHPLFLKRLQQNPKTFQSVNNNLDYRKWLKEIHQRIA